MYEARGTFRIGRGDFSLPALEISMLMPADSYGGLTAEEHTHVFRTVLDAAYAAIPERFAHVNLAVVSEERKGTDLR
ncbi:hypothetical protein ABZ545_17210 [Streptomyces abikoensis]|uniref:Uncharacterized protein n=1 Tax=Streptomyces abikoensis TaxID=97398 RepID=A0ABW7T6S4_9ACTN